MSIISLYLFPLLLLVLSAVLIYWNVRSWRIVQREQGEAADVAFHRRQFRRRIQASGMLALLAVALCVGQLIPHERRPSLYIFFWFGVFLLVMWTMLLAIGDMVVNRQRLTRFQRERRIEEARLNAELAQIRQRLPDRNGHSKGESDVR